VRANLDAAQDEEPVLVQRFETMKSIAQHVDGQAGLLAAEFAAIP